MNDRQGRGDEGGLRVVAWNANGIREEGKRREMIETARRKNVDVLAVTETHLKGKGWLGDGDDDGGGIWQGVEGGVVWGGLDEKYKGRSKGGVAIIVSKRIVGGIKEYGWSGPRVVWLRGKIGMIRYVWVCAYAPVNERTKKGKEERDDFWKGLNDCLRGFESDERVILMGDMNGKVGDERIEGVVGEWGCQE